MGNDLEHLFMCLLVLPIYLSICLSVCLSVCLSIYLSIYISVFHESWNGYEINLNSYVFYGVMVTRLSAELCDNIFKEREFFMALNLMFLKLNK